MNCIALIFPLPMLAAAFAALLMASLGGRIRAESVGLRLMPIGDSITAGYRSTTGDGYRGPLWAELIKQGYAVDFVGSQRGGAMFDPDHEGYYGKRIDQVAPLMDNELGLYKPNVVTLMIGINDLGQNYEVPTAPARLASLIDQIVAADPGVALLVGQLVCNSTASVEARVESFNKQLTETVRARAHAGKHVYMVDMSALNLADLQDGLHPNDAGYQKMADAWDAAIKKAVAAGAVAHIDFPGKFEIECAASGMAVDVANASKANAADVIQWPYGAHANQLWNFIPTTAGYYQIKNEFSALDINVSAVSKEAGASIVQWPYGAEGNDQWLPTRNVDGSYSFSNRNSGLLLDEPGGKTQGAQLDQAKASGSASQQFRLIAR